MKLRELDVLLDRALGLRDEARHYLSLPQTESRVLRLLLRATVFLMDREIERIAGSRGDRVQQNSGLLNMMTADHHVSGPNIYDIDDMFEG